MRVDLPLGEVFAVASEYVEAGRHDAAERLLGHILRVAPGQSDALHLLGLAHFRRGRLEEAAETIGRAMRSAPANTVHMRNLAEILRQLGRLEEARDLAKRSSAAAPGDALAAFNLAMVEYDRLDLPACVDAARLALLRDPLLPEAHMKLAQALLLSGDWGGDRGGDLAGGWAEYEWRYRIPGAAALMPATDRPQWDGRPLGAGRLLLVADQGYGDVIMFGRLIGWARARCAEIVLAGSAEMVGLLRQMAPGAAVATRWDALPAYAAFCALSGLPRLAGLGLADLPGHTGYLAAEADAAVLWGRRLAELVPAGMRRVGLVWSGRPTHNNDRNRSMPLAALAALGEVAGVAFVSLQKGPAAVQCRDWAGPAPLVDLGAGIGGFEDTAAILAHVDLVVSVDTAVAHLAGAMGRPAWVMLPFAPDWRWLLGRADSPWYPSLRLFRQSRPGDWGGVAGAVASGLARLAGPVGQGVVDEEGAVLRADAGGEQADGHDGGLQRQQQERHGERDPAAHQ